MFDNLRFQTTAITESMSPDFIKALWELIEELNVEKDYLQVFEITKTSSFSWRIVHSQEEPEYKREHDYINGQFWADFETAKIFVIDDGPVSTMLFSNEY